MPPTQPLPPPLLPRPPRPRPRVRVQPLRHPLSAALVLASAAAGAGAGAVGNASRTHLRIAGSSTVLPLARSWGNYDQYINILGGGSAVGAQTVCADLDDPSHVDIGDMSREWTSAEAEMLDDGYTYECTKSKMRITQIAVGMDGLAVFVARNGTADRCISSPNLGGLTLAQLRWIFSDLPDSSLAQDGLDMASVVPNDDWDGVKEWSDLDPTCPETPVNPYGSGSKSGTADFFRSIVFCPERVHRSSGCQPEGFPYCPQPRFGNIMPNSSFHAGSRDTLNSPSCYMSSEDDYEILDWVLSDTGSISYIGFGYYMRWEHVLTAVSIASDTVWGAQATHDAMVQPSLQNIVDNSYSVFRRPLYMNVNNGAWSLVTSFLTHGFSPEGQTHLADIGVVPLNVALRAKMEQRIVQQANGDARHFPTTKPPTGVGVAEDRGGGSEDFSKTSTFSLLLGSVLAVASAVAMLAVGLHCQLLWRRSKQSHSEQNARSTMQVNHAVVAALSLLPALCDDVVHCDKELRIMKPCPRLANMLGLANDEVEGNIFLDQLSPSDADRFRAHFLSSDCSQGYLAPSCNIELHGARDIVLPVRVFVISWRDPDNEGQGGYVLGLCQTDETVPRDVEPRALQGRLIDWQTEVSRMVDTTLKTELADTSSSWTDTNNITSVFGSIKVIFDALSPDFDIVQGSRAFAAMCNGVPVGQSLLTFIIEKKAFLRWVQPQVNDFLEKQEPFSSTLRLTVDVPTRRRLLVNCRLSVPNREEEKAMEAAGWLETAELPIGLLLEEPQWDSCATVDIPDVRENGGKVDIPSVTEMVGAAIVAL
mmetsp:Transcript_136450/g.436640  ORF Transcript_136450/g.436640 Transcript_136450/m.436640 type:complete len:818 (-) Transcript_136450:467-2920(-)